MAKSKRTSKNRVPPAIAEPPKPLRYPGPNGRRLYELELKQYELETRLTDLTQELRKFQSTVKRTHKQVIQLARELQAAPNDHSATTSQRSRRNHGRLRQLETKQAEWEARVDDLTRERGSVLASIEDTRPQVIKFTNLLAPIHCVPDEVLSTIFDRVCCLEDDLESRQEWLHNMPLRLLFLIRLTQVTSRWRTIAINDPLLWSHIDLHFALSTELLDLQLQRSQSAPLDIVFDFGSRTLESLWTTEASEESSEEFCQVYLPIILPTLPRWRTLAFRALGFRPVFEVFTHLRPLAAPVLESMSVETGDINNFYDGEDMALVLYPDEEAHKVFMGGAPSLSALHVHNLAFPTLFGPPVDGVRRLTVTGNVRMTYEAFAGAVKVMAKLEELVLGPDVVKLRRGEGEGVRVVDVPSVKVVRRAEQGGWCEEDGLRYVVRGEGGVEWSMPCGPD
ncbi:hypothetical protein Hypma_007349 [Hypsizygus marmoreus]|uniref:Uncharacterized protein n=1 Tax=Hypsizygus marmoreus TaxID=39966 RepID=A0A369JUI1_HYPMA|nr:hypothetical protein Hypma_007349 [Hypsizygus marmoreus]